MHVGIFSFLDGGGRGLIISQILMEKLLIFSEKKLELFPNLKVYRGKTNHSQLVLKVIHV